MTIEELFMIAIWFSIAVAAQGAIVMVLFWLLRKKQVWALIKFAMRGGTLVLKGHPNNEIEIMQTKKAIDRVTWDAKDPTTNRKIILTQAITRVYHTLKGTSYPIHFCPYTFPTNIDIQNKEKASLNTREINALMAKQYTQGAADATSFKSVAGFPIDKATLMVLILVAGLNVVTLVFAWQTLGAISP